MPRSFFIIVTLFVIVLVLPVTVRAGRAVISGNAELLYAEQSVETGGLKTLDANHFVQQYSFLWSKKDKLDRGRLGQYDLALGYEWNWVDTEINDQRVQVANPLDKILYRGDLTLAPGGLPFRMHAFSYDMQSTSFTTTDLGSLFNNDISQGASSGIISDIRNGSHVISGVTLEAGVQNGYYLGRYRDLLSTLPRLLIDYKQVVVVDVKGPTKRDYIDRDLAFVSLNKKNNWFHYRRFEHKDKIDSTQDSSEDTLLLGTIDHNNRRQWINLTNWIEVSTDISYNQQRTNRNIDNFDNVKRYDLNFFAKAKRTRWQLDNFSSFSRQRTDSRLEHNLEVPFYARGELNRDTTWRFNLVSRKYLDQQQATGTERNRDSLYLHGNVEAYRQSRYSVRPELELDAKRGSEGEGLSGKLALELYSNPSYRDSTDLFARYSVALLSGTGIGGADISFVEQMLQVRLENQLSSSYRVGGEQKVVYGTGTYDSSVSDGIRSELSDVATFDVVSGVFDGDLLRSKSSAFVEFTPQSGLLNRFTLSYELIDSTTDSGSQFSFGHRLDYTRDSLSIYWTNNYVKSASMPRSGISVGVGNSSTANSTNLDSFDRFASTLRVRYAPSRSNYFNITLGYEDVMYASGGDEEHVDAEESYEYTLWHVNGQIRKLLVLGEIAEYDKITTSSGGESEALFAFSLFSHYYPTSHTLLSARIRYEQDDLDGSETLLGFLSAGINYQKFQVSLDYSYGHRPDTATNPEVLEQKWEVTVKKTF